MAYENGRAVSLLTAIVVWAITGVVFALHQEPGTGRRRMAKNERRIVETLSWIKIIIFEATCTEM